MRIIRYVNIMFKKKIARTLHIHVSFCLKSLTVFSDTCNCPWVEVFDIYILKPMTF